MANSVKLCWSCILAALVMSLMDAAEQTRKMEDTILECTKYVRMWNELSDFLHLNQLSRAQRDWLKSSPLWTGQEDAPAGEGGVEEVPVEEVVEPEPPAEPAVEEPSTPPVFVVEPVMPVVTVVLPDATEPPAAEEPKPEEPATQEEPSTPDTEEPAKTEEPAQPEEPSQPEEPATPEEPAQEEPAPPADAIDPQAPVPRNVKCKVLLMGDSLMESLGPNFYHEWRGHTGLQFVLAAKYSTGLTRPGYFNWPAKLRTVMQKHRPDVMIVFLGANDAMPIRLPNGRSVYVTENGWQQAYKDKVREIRDIAAEYDCDVLWFGLPVFGSRYAKQLHIVETTQEAACAELGIPFVNNFQVLADANGNFQTFGRNINGRNTRLRLKDRDHMTKDGDILLIRHSEHLFGNWLKKFAKDHPERSLNDEQAKKCPKPFLHIQHLSK